VVLNSATLLVPWNVEEENEIKSALYVITSISAIINILFAIEVRPLIFFKFAYFEKISRSS
jgi:hypothetical protein